MDIIEAFSRTLSNGDLNISAAVFGASALMASTSVLELPHAALSNMTVPCMPTLTDNKAAESLAGQHFGAAFERWELPRPDNTHVGRLKDALTCNQYWFDHAIALPKYQLVPQPEPTGKRKRPPPLVYQCNDMGGTDQNDVIR